MSRMEKRIRAKRLKSLRKWAQVMRYSGYAGATLTGMASVLLASGENRHYGSGDFRQSQSKQNSQSILRLRYT